MAHSKKLILNRYRPIAQAGVGGFGAVVVAWDTRIQRRVAIKTIELNESDAARIVLPGASAPPLQDTPLWDDSDTEESAVFYHNSQMFDTQDPLDSVDLMDDTPLVRSLAHIPGLDEARTAASLSDSSIVAVYDFEVQDSTAYLIMEYVEGISLRDLIVHHDEKITLDIITAVFVAVARALEVAHNNQVLHLDIKPDNILINKRGQVKVTDFGLATLADASGFGSAGGGTIGYMPLEQMREENLDARCDEWALAAVTYELLVGKNPFMALNLKKAESAILDSELVLPSLCWEDLETGVDDPIFYALDPDREERYESVSDFAEEMEPFLGNPKRGVRELAAIVNGVDDEEDQAPTRLNERLSQIPLRDRITPRQKAVGARVISALGCALVVGLALMNLPYLSGFTNPLFWGGLVVPVAIAAWKPHIGALFAYAALAVAFMFNGAIPAGCILVLATAAWWYFIGRGGIAQANTALVVPLAGSVGLGQLAPLFAGLTLSPLKALGTTVFSILVAFLMAACGSQSLLGWDVLAHGALSSSASLTDALLSLVTSLSAWSIAASWIVAAGVLSLCRLRSTRLWAAVGTSLAGLSLIVGICVASWLLPARGVWIPETFDLLFTLLPLGLVFVACWLLSDNQDDKSQQAEMH